MESVKFIQTKNWIIIFLIISISVFTAGIIMQVNYLKILGLSLLAGSIIMILIIIGRMINRLKYFQDNIESKMTMISTAAERVRNMEKSFEKNIEYQQRNTNALFSIFSYLDNTNAPLPLMQGYAADPELSLAIVNQIIEMRPDHILDIGSGLSTILAGYTVKKIDHGQVITIEHHLDYYSQMMKQIKIHGLEKQVTLIHAPLINYELNGKNWLWYDMSKVENDIDFDLVLIDGPPGNIQEMARYPALPLLRNRLNPQALLILDDANRPAEKQIISNWMNEFPGWEIKEIKTLKGLIILKC
jgi:predicted O-methyltransferase YrrM